MRPCNSRHNSETGTLGHKLASWPLNRGQGFNRYFYLPQCSHLVTGLNLLFLMKERTIKKTDSNTVNSKVTLLEAFMLGMVTEFLHPNQKEL